MRTFRASGLGDQLPPGFDVVGADSDNPLVRLFCKHYTERNRVSQEARQLAEDLQQQALSEDDDDDDDWSDDDSDVPDTDDDGRDDVGVGSATDQQAAGRGAAAAAGASCRQRLGSLRFLAVQGGAEEMAAALEDGAAVVEEREALLKEQRELSKNVAAFVEAARAAAQAAEGQGMASAGALETAVMGAGQVGRQTDARLEEVEAAARGVAGLLQLDYGKILLSLNREDGYAQHELACHEALQRYAWRAGRGVCVRGVCVGVRRGGGCSWVGFGPCVRWGCGCARPCKGGGGNGATGNFSGQGAGWCTPAAHWGTQAGCQRSGDGTCRR